MASPTSGRAGRLPAGLAVVRHPDGANPPLPVVQQSDVTRTPLGPEIEVERREVEVAVIGGGSSGLAAAAQARAAGRDVLVLEAADGNEVMAIYAGPTIVARTPHGMLHVHAHEVIVATGAAEVHPVCPGNDLAGLLTARAAERLHAPAWTLVGRCRSACHRQASHASVWTDGSSASRATARAVSARS